jgi:hypothetical protein
VASVSKEAAAPFITASKMLGATFYTPSLTAQGTSILLLYAVGSSDLEKYFLTSK